MGVSQAEKSSSGKGGSLSTGTNLEPRNYDVQADVAGHASSLPLPATSSFAAGAFSDPNLKKASRLCGFAGTTGGDFTPHVIHVQANEDVLCKIISFFEQSPRTVYMLSATGVISSVVIRHRHDSDRFLRYEGYFEILSLEGLLVISDEGGIDSSMLSILLANPDATVFGGGVAGALIARWPIQLIVGCFEQDISNSAANLLMQLAHTTDGDKGCVTASSALLEPPVHGVGPSPKEWTLHL